MNLHRIAWIACCGGLLFLPGCHGGTNRALVERELRLQEERIYELEDALCQCEAEAESACRENEALKNDLARGDRATSASSTSPVLELPSKPKRRGRRGDEPGSPIEPPVIDPGIPIESGEEFNPSIPADNASYSPQPTDRNVVRLAFNKRLTGGINHRGHGADQGVVVVFEPRNSQGELVKVPGDVSIAVMDPSREGPEGRIARWDFTADEAIKEYRNSMFGRGYHFELPWPDHPPENKNLQLFVRFITPDGHKLLADTNINVTPPVERRAESWRTAPTRITRASAINEEPMQAALIDDEEEPEEAIADRTNDRTAKAGERTASKPSKPAKPDRPVWQPTR